jgi:hypothetical protein
VSKPIRLLLSFLCLTSFHAYSAECNPCSNVMYRPMAPETIYWKPGNLANLPAYQEVKLPVSNNPSTLNSPTVYIIFRGQSWNSTNAVKMATDAKIIIESGYLSGLKQYGTDGKAIYGGYYVDNTASPSTVENNLQAKDDEIQNVLSKTTWTKPQGKIQTSPIYVVVYDVPCNGYNSTGSYKDALGKKQPTNTIWLGVSSNNIDGFTNLFSHELVERIVDGAGMGIAMKSPIPFTNEYNNAQVADNEPDGKRYTHRIDGNVNGNLLIQAYWSIIDQAFIVPGNRDANRLLTPIWDNSGSKGSALPTYTFYPESLYHDYHDLYLASNGTIAARRIDSEIAGYTYSKNEQKAFNGIYTLTTSGQIKRYSTSGTWTVITGSNTHASAIAYSNGSVYMLAYNDGYPKQVWRYSGTGKNWNAVTGTNIVVSQLVSTNNQLYIRANNNGQDKVWQYSGSATNWNVITGNNTTVNDICSTDSGLFMSASNSGMNTSSVWKYEYSGTNWSLLTGSNTHVLQLLAAGNKIYMKANNGTESYRVWQYSGVPLTWTPITDLNTTVNNIAVVTNLLFMHASNSTSASGIWRYSGNNMTWNPTTNGGITISSISTDISGLYMRAAESGQPEHYWRYLYNNFQGSSPWVIVN